ncbi:MAG TPA: histidine phosphatase family protein [Burkholderiales bacterium]|nr:histidine phosphatase family protein [Burkholderiales bacterium]
MKEDIRMFTRPFYYLRHGETESNAARLIAGSLDVDLTALGREQARIAARALAGEPITAIYSSPLRRARHTAEPVAEALKLPITVIAEIAERNWGVLEGKPRDTRIRGTMPTGAEGGRDFVQRVLRGFSSIDADVPLIVAHSGIFRVLCRTLAIVETAGPVTNALPLRFVPSRDGAWCVEALNAAS